MLDEHAIKNATAKKDNKEPYAEQYYQTETQAFTPGKPSSQQFIEKVQNEEKQAAIRAEMIKKIYQQKRDQMIAAKLASIYQSSKTDHELAEKLQQLYYS